MKKTIICFLAFVMSLSLVACGAPKEVEKDVSKELISTVEYTFKFLEECESSGSLEEYESMKDEKLNWILSYGDSQNSPLKTTASDLKKMIEAWKSAEKDFGKFEFKKNCQISESNVGYQVKYKAKYANRDADITLSFDKDKYITSLDVNGIMSTAEIAKKAGLNTILGMGTVFGMLILISFVIYLFKFLNKPQKILKKKESQNEENTTVNANSKNDIATENINNEKEIVAAIVAAISEYTGKSKDDFIVRSIKRKGAR